MPVTNTSNEILYYTYMPSIEARAPLSYEDWYKLKPNESIEFPDIMRNSFVNIWVGYDLPWKYFANKRNGSLEEFWYGPINIEQNIEIKTNTDENYPNVFINGESQTKGFGNVFSLTDQKNKKIAIPARIAYEISEYLPMIITSAVIVAILILVFT